MSIRFEDIDPESPLEKWIISFLVKIAFYIDYTEVAPIVIDNAGAKLLNQSIFWVLYIRYKVSEAQADEKRRVLVSLIDNASKLKLDNKSLLYDYFVLMVKLFFNHDKILKHLSKRLKVSEDSIQHGDYSYLLKNGKYFRSKTYQFTHKALTVYDKYVIKSTKGNSLDTTHSFSFIGFQQDKNKIDKGCEDVFYSSSKVKLH